MRVKRYVVDSMPEALQKIRGDLGKDAVILNTKEIRSGGFLGFFGKRKIEVIAATDAAASGSAAAHKRPAAAPRQVVSPPAPGFTLPQEEPIITPIPQQDTRSPLSPQRDREDELPEIPPLMERNSPASAQAAAAAAYPEILQPALAPKSSSVSVSATTAATAAAPAPATTSAPKVETPAAPAVNNGNEDLLKEIKQMKEMVYRLSKAANPSETEQDSHELKEQEPASEILDKLENRLLDHEVAVSLARQLIQEIRQEADEELTEQAAKQAMRYKLLDILQTKKEKTIAADTKVVHFVGPTGVGKTTTIAKLAAEQVLKAQRKVGFITSDTYRIAAVEQLKTYATILNVPLEVVFSPQDLMRAFQKLEDRDIIFMDTAGRNFRNEMYVSELNALLTARGSSETFLVLSMTMKYRDMKAITENFMKFAVDKVLFTKMDETDSYGPIVNLLHTYPLQLSYVTNGQSVPDDIAEAAEEQIVDWILEGNANA